MDVETIELGTIDALAKCVDDEALAELFLTLSSDLPNALGRAHVGAADESELLQLTLALELVTGHARLRKTSSEPAPEPIGDDEPTQADAFAEHVALFAYYLHDLSERLPEGRAYIEHFDLLLTTYKALQPRYAEFITLVTKAGVMTHVPLDASYA
jgi:hypothetical protein